jgi:VWFA-related protein
MLPDAPTGGFRFFVMVIFMHFPATSRVTLSLVLVLSLFAQLPPASGQTQQQTPDEDEVIRVRAELVQASVTVLDKQGRFVDGLKREQFELRVDGKPQPISFFERVGAGSSREAALRAAARGESRAETEKNLNRGALPDRGRTFFFFVDDLHMQADSILRARKTILKFLDGEMGQNDQVAISSATGQIGFLQQLTDNKTVLRAAVERLKPLPQNMSDSQEPPMSEYLALAIQEKHDREALAFFMEPLLKEMMPRDSAETIVRGRAEQILRQSTARTENSLAALGSLVRNAAALPGRKVVYFLSDGFLLRPSESRITERMRRLTDAAARSGVVIYTADARGLATDPSLDAGSQSVFDVRASRATIGELSAMQEALRAIAEDTGGRALLNTNAVDAAISQTVKETAAYYVLAWQPSDEAQKGAKFRRLEVGISGRPDLNVLVQRGFLQATGDEQAAAAASGGKAKPEKVKTPAEELRAAIAAVYPTGALPTYLTLNYVDTPKDGTVLTALMSVPYDEFTFNPAEGKNDAAVDIEGHIYNDQGKSGSRFRERLKVSPAGAETQTAQARRRSVLFNHQVRLTPGLYQMRVAARDVQSGRIGTAMQWIEIPDLKSGRLTLGSLQLGERPPAKAESDAGTESFVEQFNAERRFQRDAHLRFLTFIYNAASGARGASPDVAIEIQIFRNNRPVVTDAPRKVATEGQDYSRIAYGAEISLNALTVGRYVLQVTATDRIANKSASQRVDFTVE